jgi:HSP20 family protein
MTEEGKEEYSHTGEVRGLGGKAKGVYGFSIRMGLEGKPIIEQFGNVRATEEGTVVAEVREPLVDVLDEGDKLVVIAEIPGVEAEDIHIEIKEDILELTAEAKDRKYSKEVLLPSPVDANTMGSCYKNGILEIKLRKK